MNIAQKFNICSNIFFLVLAIIGLIFIHITSEISFIDIIHKPLIRSWLIIIGIVCMLQKFHWHYLFYALVSIIMISSDNTFILLVCWEIIAVFGSMIVWKQLPHKTTHYLVMHTLSGALIVGGLATYYFTGTNFGHQNPYLFSFDIMEILVLTGILVNCAIFPFSSWLLKIYPELKISNLLILSSFTTKAAVIILCKVMYNNININNFINFNNELLILYIFSSYLLLNIIRNKSVMNQLCHYIIFTIIKAIFTTLSNQMDGYYDAIYILSKSVLYQSLLFLCVYYSGINGGKKACDNIYLLNISFIVGIIAASQFPAWSKDYYLLYIINTAMLLQICFSYFLTQKHKLQTMRINEKFSLIILNCIVTILIIYPSLIKFQIDQMNNGYHIYNSLYITTFDILKCLSIVYITLIIMKYLNIEKSHKYIAYFQYSINHFFKKIYLILRMEYIHIMQNISIKMKNLIIKLSDKLSIFHFNAEKMIFVLTLFTIILINYLLWI